MCSPQQTRMPPVRAWALRGTAEARCLPKRLTNSTPRCGATRTKNPRARRTAMSHGQRAKQPGVQGQTDEQTCTHTRTHQSAQPGRSPMMTHNLSQCWRKKPVPKTSPVRPTHVRSHMRSMARRTQRDGVRGPGRATGTDHLRNAREAGAITEF